MDNAQFTKIQVFFAFFPAEVFQARISNAVDRVGGQMHDSGISSGKKF